MGKFKVCTKCHKELTVDNFYKNKTSKDGIGTRCKSCLIEYTQQNKHKYQYKVAKAIYNKKYKQMSKSKEHANYISKLYYEKHKKTILKQRKQLKYSAIHKEYLKNHLEEFRIYNQNRRSTIKKMPHTFTKIQWLNTKIYFNNKCAYCGKELPLSQDHFIPLSKGGEYTINNIIPSCKSCNSSKHNNKFSEWYPTREYYDKKREKSILKFLGISWKSQQLRII